MEIFYSLESIVKILFLPFLLLVVSGMTAWNLKHKRLFENREIVFLMITILVMVLLRLFFVGSLSSRYYVVLLIPCIPFAVYLLIFPFRRPCFKTIYSVFFIAVCVICIGKALKPRHSKAYIRETSDALTDIVRKSNGREINIYDFSGETRRLNFHSGFIIQDVGEICESPDINTQKLCELINSRTDGKSEVYFIFRSRGLELAREIYLRKNRKPLSVQVIFLSKSKRNDGSCYVIARLVIPGKIIRSTKVILFCL